MPSYDYLLARAYEGLARQGMPETALATLRAHVAGRRFGPGNWLRIRDLPTGARDRGHAETFGDVWRRLHPGHARPARGQELVRGAVRAMQRGRPYDGMTTERPECPGTGVEMLDLLRAAVRERR